MPSFRRRNIVVGVTRLRHYDDLNTARFVTVTCHNRLHLLNAKADIMTLLNEIDAARRKYGFAIFAWVIMPNHFHLVLYPRGRMKLGSVIGELKSRSARDILARWRRSGTAGLNLLEVVRGGERRLAFWQRRCHDHNCRTPEDVREKISYCHLNPVRAGLVTDPGEWRWSSYRWCSDGRAVPLGVDPIMFQL